MDKTHGKLAVISTSLILPTTLLASSFVAWYLKTTNPDDVDITQELAYLRPILVTTLAVFITMTLLSVSLSILAIKKDHGKPLGKLAIGLVAITIILSLASGIMNAAVGDVEESYRKQQPTTSH